MLYCVVIGILAVSVAAETLLERLEIARSRIRHELHELKRRWDIEHYPNFLNSPALGKHAWEVMKVRLQDRILAADESPQNWLVSFMGSSVTTGRDSPVEAGFVSLIQLMMQPIFNILRIEFNATNNAMENNPCVPYDLCPKTFAGENADMIHWEQSFNCEGTREMYEQFTRQALLLPSHPIVIFSHSATDNWRADACKDTPRPHVLTDDEKLLLKVFHQHRPVEIFTAINRVDRHFGVVKQIDAHYKAAGIQVFWHQDHTAYKCLGPYIPDWGCCSAPWHPSLKGHQLRAGHHTILWLFILHDAVSELHHRLITHPQLQAQDLLLNVTAHKQQLHKTTFPLPAPLQQSEFVDGIQCITDLQPKNNHAVSLAATVVATKLIRSMEDSSSWNEHFYFKSRYDAHGLAKDHTEGRRDHVISLVGSEESGPIHFALVAQSKGKLFVCQSTGNWGKQPEGFTVYEVGGPQIFVTRVKDKEAQAQFSFSADAAKEILYARTREHGENCVTLLEDIDAGPFVLTVLPKSKKRISIATILVP